MKTKNNKKILIILPAVAVLIAGSAFALYRYKLEDNSTAPSPQNESSESNTNNTNSTSQPTKDYGKVKEDNTPIEGTRIEDEKDNSNANNVSAFITNTYQEGNTITISAIVEGATKGSCKAEFTKSGQQQINSISSDIKLVSNYYACETTLSRATIPVSGKWSVRIVADTDKGIANTLAEELEVK